MSRKIEFYGDNEIGDVRQLVKDLAATTNNKEKAALYDVYLKKHPHRNRVSLSVKVTAIKRELGFLPPKEELVVRVKKGIKKSVRKILHPVREKTSEVLISKNEMRFPFQSINIDVDAKQVIVSF